MAADSGIPGGIPADAVGGAEQGYARAQQNTGLAVAVLLKLMAAESTPASARIRAALGVVDIARAGLDFDIETRVAALERSAEEAKNRR